MLVVRVSVTCTFASVMTHQDHFTNLSSTSRVFIYLFIIIIIIYADKRGEHEW
jgi:hypothetical protein